jgi:hypothetical protein
MDTRRATEEIDIRYVEVPKLTLDKVDRIVELAKDRPTFIDGDKDWEIIWELFTLWCDQYPAHYMEFQKSIKMIRDTLKDENGFIKEDGGLIQKQLEVPETFYTMIKIFYPDQKWDRKFVAGLAKRIPILKVAKNI